MADIFISYSHLDRTTAEDLAKFLDDLGYDVWWDYELAGGANFRDEILKQLRLAKAAVVIWSKSSVDASLSKWPREEAAEADRLGILLPVRKEDLSVIDIPLGFRDYQTDFVTEPDRLLKSLEKKGVTPSRKTAAGPAPHPGPVVIDGQTIDPGVIDAAQQFARWEAIKSSTKAQDFSDFLTVNADSPLAELARIKLAGFEQSAYQRVIAEPTPARIQEFLKVYPGSLHKAELVRRLYNLESLAWAEAAKSRDPDQIAAFLRTYPDGHLATEAREVLRGLRLSAVEAAAWKKLGPAPSAEQLERFIKEFPLGAYADEARARLKAVAMAERRARRWAEIKDQPYNEPVRTFIAEFQDGPEVEAARQLLVERRKAREDADWTKVKTVRHAAPLLDFLREHPGGRHEKHAIALLKDLDRLNETEAWIAVRDAGRPDLTALFAMLFPGSAHVRPVTRQNAEPAPMPAGGSTASGTGAAAVAPRETAHRRRLVFAAVIAAASVAGILIGLQSRSGPLFAAGIVSGPAAIILAGLTSIWSAFRRRRNAWGLTRVALEFHTLAAVWAASFTLLAPLVFVPSPMREAVVPWLAASFTALLHQRLVGGRQPVAPASRLARSWTALVFFAGVIVAIACATALAVSSIVLFRDWMPAMQRLLSGQAFFSNYTFSATIPQSYIFWVTLVTGAGTAAAASLAVLQAIRQKGIWGGAAA